ncbi:formylglycine-generating enzyme family protein [Actinocrinis puniceicyclus]|uniref:Formylglycine-generating enzyme family protein n=2 Tax=Actinocrinis puniceicyclus TaxID=977794 RepID=A0A8J7WVJ1_9ACTN|nr:formylglycine-generating enzyme family protein [Actinocrinis puniceicyclus]
MVRIEGGTFLMGSAEFYPEERPVHTASVGGFWMDRHLVTVAEYRRFVNATGYVTVAERMPDPTDYPDAPPEALVPGALVFRMPPGPVSLEDWRLWWSFAPGANWRHPLGPGSTSDGRELHPVTQIAYEDALAYSTWVGKCLPTEAEWEFAARGGLEGAVFAWGDEFTPKDRRMANTWHGEFPWHYSPDPDAYRLPGTTPVCMYPPNGYGLYDMTGNVWEWTADHFTEDHGGALPGLPYASINAYSDGVPPEQSQDCYPRRVTKGGSHLCAPNYCLRYRPAARQGQTEDTATCHLGFRCIVRD